ncbi:phage protein GemA/Gp16 family protein [Sodalis glossinidius]|uniref:phage protein GemA/Gp16 family protein n=1 Tax=Sodalis glossinidius TaxID=63612 RepID=UPI001FB19E0B|nr:phage protein GemA/Gp16 family protein [Sodalis glossinidius]
MDRSTLIKLIHLARRQLQLDDETYRAALGKVCSTKTSCRDMTVPELARVLEAFKKKGFNVRSKPSLRGVKPASPVKSCPSGRPCTARDLYSRTLKRRSMSG